jgi:prepilin-type N-terminal cleavage/methylation domain-containing protein
MMADRRGLTLLEVLIALTLVVALGAIAFPMLVDRLPGREFAAASEMLVQQCGLARAHAQREGIIVELVHDPETGRVMARRSALNDAVGLGAGRDDAGFGDAISAGTAAGQGGMAGEAEDGEDEKIFEGDWVEDDEGEDRVIAAGWATYRLSDRMRLSLEAPPEDAFGEGMDGGESVAALEAQIRTDLESAEARAMAELMGAEQPFRIAAFLPDGSALIARPTWLIDDGGRAGVVTIDGWTGQAKFVKREPSTVEPIEEAEQADEGDIEPGDEFSGPEDDATRPDNAFDEPMREPEAIDDADEDEVSAP